MHTHEREQMSTKPLAVSYEPSPDLRGYSATRPVMVRTVGNRPLNFRLSVDDARALAAELDLAIALADSGPTDADYLAALGPCGK